MTRARISIAMTTYNSERFVREQLESFTRQERLPDELVVSDDASTDGTAEVVREFAGRAPFPVRFLTNNRNIGIARNLEFAISQTRGDTIFLSDSDDYWYPRKILLMERAFEDNPRAGVAICNSDLVDDRLRPLNLTAWAAIDRFSPSRRLLRAIGSGKTYRRRMPGGASCLALRAKFKPLILPLPGGEESRRRAHDHFIVRAIVCSGAGGAALLPEPLVAYRQHPGQVTHADPEPLHRRISHRLASGHERPYLLPLLIDRLEGDHATRLCVNPEIRFSALRHWRARVNMPSSFVARLPVVLLELCALRYHRFSEGELTAAKDLFFSRRLASAATSEGCKP